MNTNTSVFAAGFDASDRRIFAVMRVLGEMTAGVAGHRTYEAVPRAIGGFNHRVTGIDWDQYFTEYEAIQALIILARVHGPAATIPEEKEEEQDDSVLVFGGDHG